MFGCYHHPIRCVSGSLTVQAVQLLNQNQKMPTAAKGRGGTGKGQEPAPSTWGLCPCGCLAPVLQWTAERDGGEEGEIKLFLVRSRGEQSGLKLPFLLFAVSYYSKPRT